MSLGIVGERPRVGRVDRLPGALGGRAWRPTNLQRTRVTVGVLGKNLSYRVNDNLQRVLPLEWEGPGLWDQQGRLESTYSPGSGSSNPDLHGPTSTPGAVASGSAPSPRGPTDGRSSPDPARRPGRARSGTGTSSRPSRLPPTLRTPRGASRGPSRRGHARTSPHPRLPALVPSRPESPSVLETDLKQRGGQESLSPPYFIPSP